MKAARCLVALCLAAGGALGASHIACSHNHCCGDPHSGVDLPPMPWFVVRDAVTDAPLCNATGLVQCNSQPAGVCTVTCTDNAPSPCDQEQAGTYSMAASVAAPGYSSGQVTFPILIGSCGNPIGD